jgi:hypothetical protein
LGNHQLKSSKVKVDQKKIDAAKACFAFNKLLKTCHVTSDLECFEDRNHAVNHARTLEDKGIEVFNRGEEDQPAIDLLDSFRETNAAKTKPDANLASQKHAGGAKDTTFEQVQDDKPKDKEKSPSEIYGSEGAKGLTTGNAEATKPVKAKVVKAPKAPKEAAPKKAAVKKDVKPAVETSTVKPADVPAPRDTTPTDLQ